MKKVISFIVFVPLILIAQDMRKNSASSLFSDFKAAMIGDGVTVLVMESSHASNQAETNSGRSSDLGFGVSGEALKSPIPKLDASIGSQNDFSGKGSTKSSGSVSTRISAVIDSILGNGNVRIHGSRRIVINGEEQIISIRGIVRYQDIRSDNTIYSYQISDAEIIFEGSGMIEASQSPGWLTKLFHWLF